MMPTKALSREQMQQAVDAFLACGTQQGAANALGLPKNTFQSRRTCKIACCDCGLVHRWFIRVRGKKVFMRVDRLPKETGGRRRALWKEKESDA